MPGLLPRRTALLLLAGAAGLTSWSPSSGQELRGSDIDTAVGRTAPAKAGASLFHYEPDQIDTRPLTSPVREHPARDADRSRTGPRVLDTRPGRDISLPADEMPTRASGRAPQARPDGSLPPPSNARIAPAPTAPTYPGAGGPDAPSSIPGFRR